MLVALSQHLIIHCNGLLHKENELFLQQESCKKWAVSTVKLLFIVIWLQP